MIGWTQTDSPDEARLKELGDQMSVLIYEVWISLECNYNVYCHSVLQVHEKRYTSQKSIGLYPTTGTASDWLELENSLNYVC